MGTPMLSSTSFTGTSDVITCTVSVKNTGQVRGDEVVQLYIRDNVSSVTRPVKELKAYKRVSLDPGEEKQVSLNIDSHSLAFYDKDWDYVVEPGEFTVMVGSSSADKDLKKATFNVTEKIELQDK